MSNRTMMTILGLGLAVSACGGSPSTSSTEVTNVDPSALAPSADAGNSRGQGASHGHGCKPLDGGTSPCARGDGGDDEADGGDDLADGRDDEADGGDDDPNDDGGRPQRDAGRH